MPDRFTIIAGSHEVAEPPAGDKYYKREVKQRGHGFETREGMAEVVKRGRCSVV